MGSKSQVAADGHIETEAHKLAADEKKQYYTVADIGYAVVDSLADHRWWEEAKIAVDCSNLGYTGDFAAKKAGSTRQELHDWRHTLK